MVIGRYLLITQAPFYRCCVRSGPYRNDDFGPTSARDRLINSSASAHGPVLPIPCLPPRLYREPSIALPASGICFEFRAFRLTKGSIFFFFTNEYCIVSVNSFFRLWKGKKVNFKCYLESPISILSHFMYLILLYQIDIWSWSIWGFIVSLK